MNYKEEMGSSDDRHMTNPLWKKIIIIVIVIILAVVLAPVAVDLYNDTMGDTIERANE